MRAHGSGGGLNADPPVLFFDGLCVLCDGFAAFVSKRDVRNEFRLEPLQGEVARARIPEAAVAAMNGSGGSVVLCIGDRTFLKSEAVLRVLEGLGGGWKLVGLAARRVPRALRDAAYDLVARHRSRWFGRRAACRIPARGD